MSFGIGFVLVVDYPSFENRSTGFDFHLNGWFCVHLYLPYLARVSVPFLGVLSRAVWTPPFAQASRKQRALRGRRTRRRRGFNWRCRTPATLGAARRRRVRTASRLLAGRSRCVWGNTIHVEAVKPLQSTQTTRAARCVCAPIDQPPPLGVSTAFAAQIALISANGKRPGRNNVHLENAVAATSGRGERGPEERIRLL